MFCVCVCVFFYLNWIELNWIEVDVNKEDR